MIAYALLGIALLVGSLLIIRWFVSADPQTLVRAGKWALLGVISLLGLALVVSGRLQWALGVAMAALPWLLPLLRAARSAKTYRRMAGAGGGRTSRVETRFLRMTLDHDSGDLDGEIIGGPWTGRNLSDLSVRDLVDLLVQWREEDQQSAQVLEAYLDRCHPPWREGASDAGGYGAGSAEGEGRSRGSSGGAEGEMTREQAYQVLGLSSGASDSEIKDAYHRLIAVLHPDKGGSNYLAAKVNQARQILLRH